MKRRYTTAELALLAAAGDYCRAAGVTAAEAAEALSLILPHSPASIRAMLSRVGRSESAVAAALDEAGVIM